jgi:transcription elongation factor Elf1
MTLVRQSEREWFLELMQRYRDVRKAMFECPVCGHLQSIEDFLILGIDGAKAFQDCLGRYVNEKGCSFSVDYEDCPLDKVRIVVAKNGDEVKVFNFI